MSHGERAGLQPEPRLLLAPSPRRASTVTSVPRAPEPGQRGGGMTPAVRRQHRLGHDQIALGEVGRERAADAGRDHQRRRLDAGGARRRGARRASPTQTISSAPPRKCGQALAGDAVEAQMAGQTARLEIDGGDDEDAGHASLGGVGPEPSRRCELRALARSQAAYELPAAVSRPVNRIVRISRVGDGERARAVHVEHLHERLAARRALRLKR